MSKDIESYPSWRTPGWRRLDEWNDALFLNKTFDSVTTANDAWGSRDSLTFQNPTITIRLTHEQSCCETVELTDIAGNLDDLVGSPILIAQKSTHEGRLPSDDAYMNNESMTWTFYTFATIKGYVTLRWTGSSNGYYSEEVDVLFQDTPSQENT